MNKKNKINYETLEEITVTSQAELDMIPDGFKGIIYIEFGVKWEDRCILARAFHNKVIVQGNASVEAYGNIYVEAYGNASVEAYGNARVKATDNTFIKAMDNTSVDVSGSAFIEAYENASVRAYENASVEAYGNASVKAYENASVEAYGNIYVEAYGNASVEAYGNARVKATDNTFIKAMDNTSVDVSGSAFIEAYGNASVRAYENASVEAYGNVQVMNGSIMSMIKNFNNARIVYRPMNIEDFMNFYGIKHDKETAIFYKAVRRIPISPNSPKYKYVSIRDNNFIYTIGDKVTENCNPNVKVSCSNGIHISNLNLAIDFGCGWSDMAIIEVETKIDDIVLPKGSSGKVRTSCVKVIREVPLEECGVSGKNLIRKRNWESTKYI